MGTRKEAKSTVDQILNSGRAYKCSWILRKDLNKASLKGVLIEWARFLERRQASKNKDPRGGRNKTSSGSGFKENDIFLCLQIKQSILHLLRNHSKASISISCMPQCSAVFTTLAWRMQWRDMIPHWPPFQHSSGTWERSEIRGTMSCMESILWNTIRKPLTYKIRTTLQHMKRNGKLLKIPSLFLLLTLHTTKFQVDQKVRCKK